MALPKKKKFLKFSVPKGKVMRVVHKKRHRGFKLGFNLKKNYFFSYLSGAIETQLYFYVYPTLDLIRVYYQNILFLHKFSLASVFFFKKVSYLDYLTGLMFFGTKALYLLKNYTIVSQQFNIKLYSLTKRQGFFLSKVPGVLRVKVDKYADRSSIDFTLSSINWATLKQTQPTKKSTGSVKSYPSTIPLKKKTGFIATLAQKTKSLITKAKDLFSYSNLKQFFFRKGVGHVSTTLTSYIVSLHLETLTPKKIEHNYDSSVEVFARFFVNTCFYKKVKWKTIFKYYFWTWDPLWRRYRYRIYWLKKAIYKKMNWVVFLYFFKRLSTVQKKNKNKLVKSFILSSIPTKHWTEEGFSLGYLTRIVPQAFVYRFFFKLNLTILNFLNKMAYPKVLKSKWNLVSLQLSFTYPKLLYLSYDHLHLYPQTPKHPSLWVEDKKLKYLKKKMLKDKPKKNFFNFFKKFDTTHTLPSSNLKKRKIIKAASTLNLVIKNSF